jgi:hypothetical protein
VRELYSAAELTQAMRTEVDKPCCRDNLGNP